MSLFDTAVHVAKVATILTWDFVLTVINAVSPRKPNGTVIPLGLPGYNGIWPPFEPPKETDSRSPCPALNAMANHGIFPHDGRNISYREWSKKLHETFNFAESFCYFGPYYFSRLMKHDYNKDTFNLEDLSMHNGVEHDASLTRQDASLVADQSKPDLYLVNALLDSASGPNGQLTIEDLQRYSTIRRDDARATNPDFTLAKTHKIFGSCNSATMIVIFGGRKEDLRCFLVEEKFPAGWEPAPHSRMGLTIAQFNRTVFKIENGIKESRKDL